MTDSRLRSLMRSLASLSDEERRKSTAILLSFEHELKNAGFLGDPSRLPELGALLREAKLTANGKSDGTGWFCSYWAPGAETGAETNSWKTEHADTIKKFFRNRSLDAPFETRAPEWPAWTPPAVGAVVQRYYLNVAPGGSKGAYFGIVKGAICDHLLYRNIHASCETCSCYSLASCALGAWELDAYYWDGDTQKVKRVRGSPMDKEGFITNTEFPYNIRRVSIHVPADLIRESLRDKVEEQRSKQPRT